MNQYIIPLARVREKGSDCRFFMADIPNDTDLAPVLQISEVIVGKN